MDKYDGITIGTIATEKYLEESGIIKSDSIGKDYSLIYRDGIQYNDIDVENQQQELTNVLYNENDNINSKVFEVVRPIIVYRGANVITTQIDVKTARGEVYGSQYVYTGLSTGDVLYGHIKATTKDLIPIISLTSTGDTILNSYENTTYTDDGNSVPIFNYLVGGEDNSTAGIYSAPTIDTLGTQRFNQFLPGGSKKSSSGVVQAGSVSIIQKGEDILMELQYLGETNGKIGVEIIWYEI